MKNTLNFETNKTRIRLRCGTREVLALEGELPVGETPLACHLRELAQRIFDHAEQAYLPEARGELEQLACAGRGYDFAPHRLQFCAKASPAHGRVRVELSLQYKGGAGVLLAQHARQIWSADGAYRLR